MKKGTEHALGESLQKRLCEKKEEKQEGSCRPPRIMKADPAKPGFSKWTESKPRKKTRGGNHIQAIIKQYGIINNTNSLFC